jgi:two-component system chemotaxis response regulator CheB
MTLSPNVRNIVVIGASAGGVQALQSLFSRLPGDLPAAFFVVLHLSPHAPTRLHQVLAMETAMPVELASDGLAIRQGHVYVATTDRHLLVDKDVMRVTRGPKECRVRPAIDALFRSAANAYGARVVGVVLSGALDDGTAGLWSVKDQGGLAFVQLPSEAAHASMPSSAMEHVDVDLVAPISELAMALSKTIGSGLPIGLAPTPRARHEVETEIARDGKGLEAGVMTLGPLSKYTCPDCHGVLVQIEEGPIVRFRCHTGHAFSMKTLVAEVDAAIDEGLWHTLRAIEERVILLRQMAALAARSERPDEEMRLKRQAEATEARLAPLRGLVLDASFFGHDPDEP